MIKGGSVVQIADINFKLNLLFLVVLALFSLAGLFLEASLSFVVVTLHELAHSLVAYRHGVKINEVELLPFGGVAKFRDLLQLKPQTEIKVALAGPILNFCLAGVALLLINYELVGRQSGLFLLRVNLSIGLFNLLPVLPLDGGRILRANLTERYGFKEATYKVLKFSKFFAFLAGGLVVLGLYFGYINIALVIICFFIYFAALKEGRYTPYVLMQYIARKKGEVLNKNVLAAEGLVAFADTSIQEIIDRLVPNKFHLVVVVDDQFHVLGIVTEDKLIDSLIEQEIELAVGELVDS